MKKYLLVFSLMIGFLFSINPVVAEFEKPDVVSDYVYVYDRTTGQVFWDKGSSEKIYPASLTKLMTALVAIENAPDVEKEVLIDEKIMKGLIEAGASRAGFNVGDVVTIRDLLYGTLLPSGAECTQALAYTISGSVEGFVDLMNKKALELGMSGTNFVNTTGLHDNNHYSTLYDISLLLEEGLKNDLFKEIFTSMTYQAKPSFNYPNVGLKMESTAYKFINNPTSNVPYKIQIDGFLGSKTGYTGSARYCLASIAEINGMDLVSITAHAWVNRQTPSHFLDAEKIYSAYRDNYQRVTVFETDEVIQQSVAKYKIFNKDILWQIPDSLVWDMPIDSNNYRIDVTIPSVIETDINKGDIVGEIIITSFNEEVLRKQIISNQTIKQNSVLVLAEKSVDWIQDNMLVSVFGLVLCGGAVILLVTRKKK